jgi:hypothetical protein
MRFIALPVFPSASRAERAKLVSTTAGTLSGERTERSGQGHVGLASRRGESSLGDGEIVTAAIDLRAIGRL